MYLVDNKSISTCSVISLDLLKNLITLSSEFIDFKSTKHFPISHKVHIFICHLV